MTFKRISNRLEDFFFTPQSPLPVAIFRILYGLCAAATLILLHADWLDWFGAHSWISQASMSKIETGIYINIFSFIPQDDRWISALFWIALTLAAMVIAGLWTRLSSALLFLCLSSIQQRNPFITHGGDAFLRVAGFLLIFAPAGAALSIDRLIQVKRHGARPIQLTPPWAQRMIQFELAFLYLTAFLWKAKGHTWWNGTALYYVMHLAEFRQFPLPSWILNPLVLKLGTWYALCLEFSLGLFVWFKRVRYPLLVLGILFHLFLEYATNIPMFQWDILAAYILFVDPSDLSACYRFLRPPRRGDGKEEVLARTT